MMFDKICIIGVGLIGSSIARAIRQHDLCKKLTCSDMSEEVCVAAKHLSLADDIYQDASKAVENADLVIICVPVGAYAAVMRQIAGSLKDGAIVTDVGSTKTSSIEAIAPLLPEHAHFVPGHPIAGTEQSGPDAGFPELFIGRWFVATPAPETEIRAVERVTAMWEAFGSRIEIMDPQRHDLVLAITSHLPHLIAYTIVGTATDMEDQIQSEVVKFSASGFRDFTRIAASDPVMWRDIFLNNKDAVLEVLQRFNEDLTALQKSIRWQDGRYLEKFFTRTRKVRREVIDAGQADYVYPDKGGAIVRQEGTPPAEGQ